MTFQCPETDNGSSRYDYSCKKYMSGIQPFKCFILVKLSQANQQDSRNLSPKHFSCSPEETFTRTNKDLNLQNEELCRFPMSCYETSN